MSATGSSPERTNEQVGADAIRRTAVAPTLEDAGDGPRYEFEIDLETHNAHASVVRLVGEGKHVLDLGCATGYMSRVLRSRGCSVIGVELDPKMAEVAAQHCDRLIVGDLDTLDLEDELAGERFDAIVAADVLEHLKDPLRVLRSLHPLLAEDGFVVASIPNVAHGSVRLALLAGRFPYQEGGLLDRTHLRFFTLESIAQLFEDAGYLIADVVRHDLIISASEVPFDVEGAPEELRTALESDPDATTYQFIIKAFALEQPGMRAVQEHVRRLALERGLAERQLATEREAAERELGAEREAGARWRAECEATVAQFADLQQTVATIAAREGELRGALVSAHDQLLQRDEGLNALAASAEEEQIRLQQEADAARQEAEAARQELDAARWEALELRVRLERIRDSAPVALYTSLKSLPGLRAVDARRISGFNEALRRASRRS